MAQTDVTSPYFDQDSLRSTNFFNGRLLTGDDLTREQQATQVRLGRLGRAAGEGVATGFWASSPGGGNSAVDPVVSVTAGLAINREGDALELLQDVSVHLVRAAPGDSGVTTTPGIGFGDCAPAPSGTFTTGEGLYLLTVSPARGTEGRAPMQTLGNATIERCGARWNVEGLQFRIVDLEQGDIAGSAKARNQVAYRCFGSPDSAFLADPFGPPQSAGYGLVDELRAAKQLADCEVPIAVVGWSSTDGIRFVDNWSVRRRLIAPATGPAFLPLLDDRRAAEAEAMMLQFQEQLTLVRDNSPAQTTAATSLFDYLPPIGMLPIANVNGSTGFDDRFFFGGLTTRGPFTIEGARAAMLLRLAIGTPPMALAEKKLIWLYRVRENIQFGAKKPGSPYYLFASGQLPYMGEPHYDVSHWSGSNFPI